MTAWTIRKNIILPETGPTRCRYVDLEKMKQSNVVGQASTYVSYSWSAPWGAMVTAVSSGADLDRRIWCDLFAVRQWPGNTADLNFRQIIPKCSSFVLCSFDTPSLHHLPTKDIRDKNFDVIPDATKANFSLFRLWCLVELHTALLSRVPIIIRHGRYHHSLSLSLPFSRSISSYIYQDHPQILSSLLPLVDLLHAQTSLESDKDRILKEVEESPGGYEGLNTMVKCIVKGKCSFTVSEVVLMAVCGDKDALNTILTSVATLLQDYLVQAASGGYLEIVRRILEKEREKEKLLEGRSHGMTCLMAAAYGGHVETVKYLLEHSAQINAAMSGTGNTALSLSAINGFHETAHCLLLNSAAIDTVNSTFKTPLMLAAEYGHTATVNYLLSRGANINHHDITGCTPLYMAAAGGHASTMKLLLSKGAQKGSKNIAGLTPLAIAEKNEFPDCVTLLVYEQEKSRNR